MTSVSLSPIWNGDQFFDSNGNLLAGGKIYTFQAGSFTVQQTTWSEDTGTSTNTNPIILDASGRIQTAIWLQDGLLYNFVLKDSNDAIIPPNVDNVSGSSAATITNSPAGGINQIQVNNGASAFAAIPYGAVGYILTAQGSGALPTWVPASSSVAGVSSFNSRTGAVTLDSADVTAALGFTPISGNQSITVSGDASGSGTTAIALTLANVNSQSGLIGDSLHVPVFITNAKGLVTSQNEIAIPNFTSSVQGLAPASGGGTVNFLRADGTWQPAAAGTVTSVGVASTGSNSGALTVSGSPLTSSGTIDLQLNTFSSSLAGVVPASGGGTATYLRADGTWVAPSGSGTVSSVAVTSSNLTVTGSPITGAGTIDVELPASGVTAGSYTAANITVDTYGRVTAAANGAGGGVSSGTGVANRVLINGTTGSPQTGALTFSLPQDIAPTSNPTFAAVTLGGYSEILQPNTFGSVAISGQSSGWAGIQFPATTGSRTIMMEGSGAIFGVYNVGSNAWEFYFTNGTLTVGAVPVSLVTGISGGTGISYGGGVITNTGVTSLAAGTGVGLSASTGAVTVSIGQAVGTGNAPTFAGLTVNGNINATGDITAFFSDDRLKIRSGNIKNAVEKVEYLNGFHYRPNATAQALGYEDEPNVGLSAQEVSVVLPEAIADAPIDPQYMAIKYEKLIPLLVEAIKELSARLTVLGG